MVRSVLSRLGPTILVAALAGVLASSAYGWTLRSSTTASIAYNEGITFDQTSDKTSGSFFFSGVLSTTNSRLYRTNAQLSQSASNSAVLPATTQGYNHIGDLSFDPAEQRILLPLECYYPTKNPSNTCGTGAIGVADPGSLKFLYYVNLAGIPKAMWSEVTPDNQSILTSNGTGELLAFSDSAVSAAAEGGTITGTDLGIMLPSPNVTGAAFYGQKLLLSLNLGPNFEVISYALPLTAGEQPTTEITVTKSFTNNEPEGLAVTNTFNGSYPLGATLHWQMLPFIPLYSRILNYMP